MTQKTRRCVGYIPFFFHFCIYTVASVSKRSNIYNVNKACDTISSTVQVHIASFVMCGLLYKSFLSMMVTFYFSLSLHARSLYMYVYYMVCVV